MIVAEAVLNLACVGARPVALVNNLNFGNPEHPEVMWQLSEAVDGMAEACRALGIPVIGGNVSLYNESRGRDIDPTPVVGLLGVIDELVRRPPGPRLVEGHRLAVLGPAPPASLAGARVAAELGFGELGALPPLDLDLHRRVATTVRDLVSDAVVSGVHDVAEGGLAMTLAEMAVRSGVGFKIARVHDLATLYGESPSRVVLSVAPDRLTTVEQAATNAQVPITRIGLATGDRLIVQGMIDVDLEQARSAWRDQLPSALGHGTAQT